MENNKDNKIKLNLKKKKKWGERTKKREKLFFFFFKTVFGFRKIFSGKYLFSGNAIFRKGKYFQVFGCIWENIVKNIFWCLVVLLKIPWKIHFLLLAHIFSDFLRCQTNIIISFLNPETQITPRKKNS